MSLLIFMFFVCLFVLSKQKVEHCDVTLFCFAEGEWEAKHNGLGGYEATASWTWSEIQTQAPRCGHLKNSILAVSPADIYIEWSQCPENGWSRGGGEGEGTNGGGLVILMVAMSLLMVMTYDAVPLHWGLVGWESCQPKSDVTHTQNTRLYTCAHTHTHAHTCTYTWTHTHIYTHSSTTDWISSEASSWLSLI